MPSTKDIVLTNYKLKVLVYGQSGTYKTRFAGTFPAPYFFDFDGGMLSLAGEEGIEYDTYEDTYKGNKVVATAAGKFRAAFDEKAVDDKYETLVIDSITTYERSAMNEQVRLAGRTEPSLHEWGRLLDGLEDLFTHIKALNKHVVVVAHEQLLKDEITGEISIVPLISGRRLPHKMALFFDEVWRAQADVGKEGQRTFTLLTHATKKYTAKSRLGILEVREKPDFRAIMEKIAEKGKGESSDPK